MKDLMDEADSVEFEKFLEESPLAKITHLGAQAADLKQLNKNGANSAAIDECIAELREFADQTEDCMLAALAQDELDGLAK